MTEESILEAAVNRLNQKSGEERRHLAAEWLERLQQTAWLSQKGLQSLKQKLALVAGKVSAGKVSSGDLESLQADLRAADQVGKNIPLTKDFWHRIPRHDVSAERMVLFPVTYALTAPDGDQAEKFKQVEQNIKNHVQSGEPVADMSQKHDALMARIQAEWARVEGRKPMVTASLGKESFSLTGEELMYDEDVNALLVHQVNKGFSPRRFQEQHGY